MSAAIAIVPHVEAAKRLLRELGQNATAAIDTLARDGGAELLAAVEQRGALLNELREVADALAHERASGSASGHDADRVTSTLLADVAAAAAAALETHEQLVSRTRLERDRLAAALHRAKQPDTVADVYAAATGDPRPRTLSVTG
jgi:hypothetical protein